MSAGRLIAYIDHAWDRRRQLQARIRRAPALRERALQNNEIAVRLLSQSVKGGMAAKAGASSDARCRALARGHDHTAAASGAARRRDGCPGGRRRAGRHRCGARRGRGRRRRSSSPSATAFGGNATAALVMPLMSFHTQQATLERPGAAKLFPTDHGEVSGGGRRARQAARPAGACGRRDPAIDCDRLHRAVRPSAVQAGRARALDDAGVQLLFHAFASDVEHGGPVQGVVFETKSGPLVIRARVVVDCTGDADVAARGARHELGREQDGLVQPMTLMFRMVQFERAGFEAYWLPRIPSSGAACTACGI